MGIIQENSVDTVISPNVCVFSARRGKHTRTKVIETNPTPYPPINALLQRLLVEARTVLGDQLVGMYVCGSLASGDFSPATSDVDFVVVTAEALPEPIVAELEAMHMRLLDSGMEWASKLEGTYFPRAALRHYQPSDTLYPSLNEAKFYLGGHGSDWVIGSHILREHGLSLAGPPPQDLIDPVAPEELRQATRELLRQWWAPMLADPARLRGDDYQAYAVLTMCRALYTLEHGAVVSKPAAARWAQQVFGGPRATLIERALAWRPGTQLDALDEVLGLVRYVLERSQEP